MARKRHKKKTFILRRSSRNKPMPPNPIYIPVDGAPYQNGDQVRVVQVVDETVDPRFVGMTGKVIYLEYDCGCGQKYPDDPMIGVHLENGELEEFWKEELEYDS